MNNIKKKSVVTNQDVVNIATVIQYIHDVQDGERLLDVIKLLPDSTLDSIQQMIFIVFYDRDTREHKESIH